MAFRLREYIRLLERLRGSGYGLRPVKQYFQDDTPPAVFLKHDVDRLPGRAVRMAVAEHELDIEATYYFRCNGHAEFPESEIRAIQGLGHEIGFHYESMVRARGDLALAAVRFDRELAALRRIVDVRTIAAHGSPLSAVSNRGPSFTIDRQRLGLLGEPGVHFDFSRVLFVTDTGGIFGSPHNLRDWVDGRNLRTPTLPGELAARLTPEAEPLVLLSTHPERWPTGRLGLLQASIQDVAVNLVKMCRARHRAVAVPR